MLDEYFDETREGYVRDWELLDTYVGESEREGQYKTLEELKEKIRWIMTEDHVACRMGVESVFPRMWRSYDASYGDQLDPFPTEQYDADLFSPSKIRPKPKAVSKITTSRAPTTTAPKQGKSKVGRKKRTKDSDGGEENKLGGPSSAVKTTTPAPVKAEEKKEEDGGLLSWLWGGSSEETDKQKEIDRKIAEADAKAAANAEKKAASSARALSAAESIGSSDEYERTADGKINPVKSKWKILYKRVEYFMAELGEKRQRVCIPVDFNKDRVWNEKHINYF